MRHRDVWAETNSFWIGFSHKPVSRSLRRDRQRQLFLVLCEWSVRNKQQQWPDDSDWNRVAVVSARSGRGLRSWAARYRRYFSQQRLALPRSALAQKGTASPCL